MPVRFRVEITATAERDVRDINEYIAGDNPAAARLWVTEIRRQMKSLSHLPRRGAVVPESQDLGVEYRHLVYGSYRTIYRIVDRRVLVVRVIHGAQLLRETE